MNTFQDIIRQYVSLPNKPSAQGWFSIKCQLCNDYKKRGAFRFVGDTTIYNCFNCTSSASFDPSKHTSIPQKMKAVLEGYQIPLSEFNEILFDLYKNGNKPTTEKEDQNSIKFKNIQLPPYFIKLDPDSTDVWHKLACTYLEVERGIDPTSYDFMMLDRSAEDVTKIDLQKWKGRLLIPYMRHGSLIFYQGRDLYDSGREKYMSPAEGRDTAMFGYDQIYDYTEKPLYIHEGFFDAFVFGNSVATFSNKLTDKQIEILNRCKRPKVVIPDRKGNGNVAAIQGLEQGWSVSLPDIGHCKDINEAVMKYGKLYVTKSVMENTYSGFNAETRIALLCKK